MGIFPFGDGNSLLAVEFGQLLDLELLLQILAVANRLPEWLLLDLRGRHHQTGLILESLVLAVFVISGDGLERLEGLGISQWGCTFLRRQGHI